MNITIVDDEKNYALQLKQIVSDMCTESNITNTIRIAKNPEAIFDNDAYRYFDVILLDIHMPEVSGIQVASRINDKKTNAEKPYIIFVSKRDDLVFDALKEFPYSFIRKACIQDLKECLIRINNKMNQRASCVIKSGRSVVNLFIDEIIYITKKNNYVIIHTRAGAYKERSTIDKKLLELADFVFLRSSIGCIINTHYISCVENLSIKLINGEQLSLSKRYRREFVESFYKERKVDRSYERELL